MPAAAVSVKKNVGFVSLVGEAFGGSGNVITGAVVSTVKLKLSVGPVLPAASTALTDTVYVPSVRLRVVNGEEQVTKGSPA